MIRSAALLLTAALTLAPTAAWSHAGHDHGAAPTAEAAPTAGQTLMVSKESQFLLKIRTQPASTASLARRIVVNGKLKAHPQGQANVMSPVSGSLVAGQNLPTFGQRVRKGQLLAVVAQTLSASELLQARTSLTQAEADLRQTDAALVAAANDVAVTRATWQRLQRLSQVVAGKDIPQAEQAYRAAVANEQALKARRDQLRRQAGDLRGVATGQAGGVRRFELRSPIDGVVAARDAVAGSTVGPETRLFEIVDARNLWVEAQVFETDLAAVESATVAQVRTAAYPDRTFAAKLVGLGQVVDEATRTVSAVFAVANPQGQLRIGQFAEVAIASPVQQAHVVVPKHAVYEQAGKRWLFVHTKPELFERREVSLGEAVGDRVSVLKGLAAGERVVVEGGYPLLNMQARP